MLKIQVIMLCSYAPKSLSLCTHSGLLLSIKAIVGNLQPCHMMCHVKKLVQPSSVSAERVFSILKWHFTQYQNSALQHCMYIEVGDTWIYQFVSFLEILMLKIVSHNCKIVSHNYTTKWKDAGYDLMVTLIYLFTVYLSQSVWPSLADTYKSHDSILQSLSIWVASSN